MHNLAMVLAVRLGSIIQQHSEGFLNAGLM